MKYSHKKIAVVALAVLAYPASFTFAAPGRPIGHGDISRPTPIEHHDVVHAPDHHDEHPEVVHAPEHHDEHHDVVHAPEHHDDHHDVVHAPDHHDDRRPDDRREVPHDHAYFHRIHGDDWDNHGRHCRWVNGVYLWDDNTEVVYDDADLYDGGPSSCGGGVAIRATANSRQMAEMARAATAFSQFELDGVMSEAVAEALHEFQGNLPEGSPLAGAQLNDPALLNEYSRSLGEFINSGR